MSIKNIKVLFVLISISLLSACSGTKNTFDYDSSVDFSQIKTYQWNLQPSEAFSKANPLISKRIISAIEDNLKRKGLKKSDVGDIKVSYMIGFEKKLKTGGLTAGIGMSVGSSNRGHINLSSGNKVRQSIEGTLIIDMVSSKNGELIWRSTTVKPVKDRDASPEDSKKRIGQLIYQMFENYPPKKSK